MKQTMTATYRNGVFYPDMFCNLPEGARVEVTELPRDVRPSEEPTPTNAAGLRKRWSHA